MDVSSRRCEREGCAKWPLYGNEVSSILHRFGRVMSPVVKWALHRFVTKPMSPTQTAAAALYPLSVSV